MMNISATEIAALVNGDIEGNAEIRVEVLVKIEEGVPGALSFLSNAKYESFLYETKSSIVIVHKDLKLSKKVEATIIRTGDPYFAFSMVLQKYFGKSPFIPCRE
jgi:UDP-3-O-[3-hydroxymyristoyl] glucosamine N-acyltransferase